MTEGLHVAAALAYLVGVVLGWRERPGVTTALAVGVGIHGLAFVAMHARVPTIPLESFPAALSLIGWLIPVVYLASLRFVRVSGVGTWVAALASGFGLFACLGLFLVHWPVGETVPGGAWSHAHVLLSALGFSLLALTSLAGLAYLAKERALKSKRAMSSRLPSLESLDRLEHLTLGVGFSLLTLGVVSGFVWGISHGKSPWTYHSLTLVVAWLIYLFPVGMRVANRQHGDRPARVVVGGFGVLAISYLGVRVVSGVLGLWT